MGGNRLVPQLLLKQSDTLHTQYTLDSSFFIDHYCAGGEGCIAGYLISIAYCPFSF